MTISPRAGGPVKDSACSADTGVASSPGEAYDSRVATGTCPLADDASTNLYWLNKIRVFELNMNC